MSQWWESGNVQVNQWDRCYHCNCKPSGPPAYIVTGTNFRRGKEVTVASRVCEVCLAHEEAILEARDKGWRFCEINVAEPCDCGRPYVPALQACWLCAYERRMLEKQQREIRFARRIIQRIRSEVRQRERSG